MATKSRMKTVQTPFYAYVGVTDLAVEAVRDVVNDMQTRVRGYRQDISKSVSKVDLQPKTLRKQAADVPSRVQSLVDDNVASLNDAYGDLVKRGESLVGRISRQQSVSDTSKAADTTVAKAKTVRTQATNAAKVTTKTAAKSTKRTAKTAGDAAKTTAKTANAAAKKTADSANNGAEATATSTKRSAKKVSTTAKKESAPAVSSVKATTTAATKTAAAATKATVEAAEKVGD